MMYLQEESGELSLLFSPYWWLQQPFGLYGPLEVKMERFLLIANVVSTVVAAVFFILALIAWIHKLIKKEIPPSFDLSFFWSLLAFIITSLIYIAGRIVWLFQR
jgi:hypothetical protein